MPVRRRRRSTRPFTSAGKRTSRSSSSHFHCHDHDNPELAGEALEWFARSRREGVRIIADAYPYEASSTSILPEFVERRTRVLVTWSKPHPEMGGRYLDEIADDWEGRCADGQHAVWRRVERSTSDATSAMSNASWPIPTFSSVLTAFPLPRTPTRGCGAPFHMSWATMSGKSA